MRRKQIVHTLRRLENYGVEIEKGLTGEEFDKIEEMFGFKFPPDLRILLKNGLPVGDKFPNWRLALRSEKAKELIEWRMSGPLEGILFDVKVNTFWYEEWGEKPDEYEDQKKVVEKQFVKYPILIPIYGHRYIPCAPLEMDNPVFSVVQTDIIYYGNNLYNYLKNEFNSVGNFKHDFEYKRIDFWSHLVDLNY